MIFPDRKYPPAGAYLDAYATEVEKALESVDRTALNRALRVLTETIERDGHIYACRNAGSAAFANHLQCDHAKGISTDTNLRPRVRWAIGEGP